MEDVAPALIAAIQKQFAQEMQNDAELTAKLAAILNGSTSYTDALDYSDRVGHALAAALQAGLVPGALPADTLYYNIAQRLLENVGGNAYDLAAAAAEQVQSSINLSAQIGLKAVAADTKAERITGLVNAVSGQPLDTALQKLVTGASELPQGAASDTLKANAAFQSKVGLRAKIIRKAEFKCCAWCSQLAGIYEYPVDNDDVYRRHSNCRCKVEYDPGDGKRQTIHAAGDDAQRKAQEQEKQARLDKYQAMTEEEQRRYDVQRAARERFSKKKESENVLPEYLRNAKPGVGSITYDTSYDVGLHSAEVKTAQWLHENLGGDIVLLNEINKDLQKTPDYLWRTKFWDLKSISSEKAANSAVRHGIKQIIGNPGGLILDFGNNSCSANALWEVIDKRMAWYVTKGSIDMLILQNGKLIAAKRY